MEGGGLRSAAIFNAIVGIWVLALGMWKLFQQRSKFINILAGSAPLISESLEQKAKWETGVGTPELILARDDWI